MGLLGTNRDLRYTQESGTSHLRDFVRNRIIDGSEADERRIARYELYFQFYKGNHWAKYNETMMSFNFCRAFVDKVPQFLVGKKGFTIQVSGYGNETIEKELEEASEKMVLRHWERNDKNLKVYEMLQMGGITGDLWVMLSWVAKGQYVKITVLDSRHCIPEFNNGDVEDMSAMTVRTPLLDNENKYRLKVSRYTKNKVQTWYQKDTVWHKGKEPNDLQFYSKIFELQETENPLGFIPIVHIKNKPTSEGYYSTSDISDILKLNKVYNELSQEIKSIIDYYVAPTTIVTGATMGNLTKKIGNVWSGLPPEANVFNLGLDVDLSAAQGFMDLIKTSMHELSDVPENFLGKIQPISNTSAAALQLTYQPIIQQADMKWLTYGAGIVEINNMIFKFARYHKSDQNYLAKLEQHMRSHSEDGFFEDSHRLLPIFAYGFPQDRFNELSMAETELRLKLNSRRRIMERLGTNNIPELEKEIEIESLKMAELEASIVAASQPGIPGLEQKPQGDAGNNVTPDKLELPEIKTAAEDFLTKPKRELEESEA